MQYLLRRIILDVQRDLRQEHMHALRKLCENFFQVAVKEFAKFGIHDDIPDGDCLTRTGLKHREKRVSLASHPRGE
jgi:hypothetical protein